MVTPCEGARVPLTEPKPANSVVSSPGIEYAHRLAARRQEETRQAQRHATWVRARNAAFVLIVLVAWLGEKEKLLPLLLTPPAVVFVVFMLRRNWAGRASARRPSTA